MLLLKILGLNILSIIKLLLTIFIFLFKRIIYILILFDNIHTIILRILVLLHIFAHFISFFHIHLNVFPNVLQTVHLYCQILQLLKFVVCHFYLIFYLFYFVVLLLLDQLFLLNLRLQIRIFDSHVFSSLFHILIIIFQRLNNLFLIIFLLFEETFNRSGFVDDLLLLQNQLFTFTTDSVFLLFEFGHQLL